MMKKEIRQARTCYGHLAGVFGVAVTEALLARGVLELGDGEFAVTAEGERWFQELGIEVESVRKQKRQFAKACLDGSEKRLHLGGALGVALAERMFELGWIARIEGSRGVRVTAVGEAWLAPYSVNGK